MTTALLCLLGPLLVGLWWFARPRLRFGILLLLWWSGLILVRLVPPSLQVLLGNAGIDPAAGGRPILLAVGWIGALLLLRAMIGLASWGRPWRRRERVFGALLALSFFLAAWFPDRWSLFLILSVPWFWSFRWRAGLGAGGLTLASLGAFVSFLLVLVTTGTPAMEGGLHGAVVFSRQVTASVLFYSFFSLFATAGRIHLSIRRIRTRLVSSHVLAGVVPFLLAVLFLLLAGALYLSTYRGSLGARLLQERSRAAELRLARDLMATGRIDPRPFGEESPGQIVLLRAGEGPAQVSGGVVSFSPDSLLATRGPTPEVPLLWDGETLFLRARLDTLFAGRRLQVEVLAPVDSLRMAAISELVGTPVRVNPFLRITVGGGIQIGPSGEEREQEGTGDPSGVSGQDREAIGPRGTGEGRVPGGAIVSCLHRSGERWVRMMIPISSSAGLSEPLLSLFQITRENPLAWMVVAALGFIAVFFLGAIWITIGMVSQMVRSITRAVQALTRATAELGEGKLDHRIEIAGSDELWNVATSFNEMAEGLEKMRRIERETHRLEEELRLAREIQTRLLPSAPPQLDRLELAGVSLPARQVGGDYYDYIVLEGGQLGITVADVSGKGAPAALLMSSFRASLRTQDLASLGPAEVLGRLNRFIHASVDPGKFITAFLGLIDPVSGALRYANAGHDPPLLVKPDGATEELAGGGLILGMLPQIVYEEARMTLEPGALLAIFTDGVTEAQSPEGEFFGTERVAASLIANRKRPCKEALQQVVRATSDFAAGAAQFDDLTMILLRMR